MMTKPTIAHYFQQNTKTLGNLLNKLNQLTQWNTWLRECLGEEAHVMDHCHAVNLSGNSLIVIADSPHWVTRLRFHIPDLLPKLQKYKGLEHIKAICCKTYPKHQISKQKKPQRSKLSLKSETAALVLKIANKTKDDTIKLLLEKIAAHKN